MNTRQHKTRAYILITLSAFFPNTRAILSTGPLPLALKSSYPILHSEKMSTRTISWYESTYDLEKISENQWQFQIAKLVVTAEGSPPVSNVIWKSLALQPLATISWPVKYGLNWSTNPPTDGVTVTVGGRWQACDKGQAFDLTKLGEWTPSATSGTPGWLTVGNIEYAYPGGNGINIVIGVQNGTAWEPIFIDPTNLPPGSSGSYQPQEEAKWWLENSNLTGSVYSM